MNDEEVITTLTDEEMVDWANASLERTRELEAKIETYKQWHYDNRQRIKELEKALKNLLEDTQHSEHYCGDEDCPVAVAKRVLNEK